MSDMPDNVYATLDELKYALELTGTQYVDGDLPSALEAASRAVDDSTGRRFYVDADATQKRYYSPLVEQTVEIDDVVTLTSVKTDHDGDGTFEMTWTVNRDFVLEPLNAPSDGRPYERLRVHPAGTLYQWPVRWPRSVEVTGKFGWESVPAGVHDACMIIATRVLRRKREAPFGVIAVGLDGAAIRIARTDPDVIMLLGNYNRHYAFA